MKSILLLLIYYSMFIYSNYLNGTLFNIVNISMFIILMILSIILNINNIKDNKKSLKDDLKNNKSIIIKYTIIAIISYIISTILVGVIADSANLVISEELVDDSNLIQVFINLLIWAPITEELLFRCLMKKDINNKYLYIILSTLLFVGVHVLGNGLNIITLINSLPFIVMGLYFSILYLKIDNIIINIVMHLFANIVGVVMILSMI